MINMTKPDAFSYHEVMDRALMVSAHLDTSLGEHPVVLRHPALSLALDEATDALLHLYSEAARIGKEEHP